MTEKKIPNRQLSTIVDDIKVALRHDTKNALRLGDLLREMKASPEVKHGDWGPLLKNHFDLPESTARNYIKASEYNEAKSATVANLDLAPSVLYALARGDASFMEAEEHILKAAETGRVDMDRACEIHRALVLEQEPELDPESPEDEADDDGGADTIADDLEQFLEAKAKREAEEEAEADAILDEPPPALPPPEPPAPSPKEASSLSAFEQGVELLRGVMTQPAAKFTATYFSSADMASVADFLKQVAEKKIAAIKERKAA
jgi:hypothetical protein